MATPATSRPATGSSAMTVVLIERISVWLTARFAASSKLRRSRLVRPLVFSCTLS